MRILDDKIVYALNTSIPTESFASKVNAHSACEDLYSQIQKGNSQREDVIKNCIVATAEEVKKLKTAKEEKPNDIEVLKNLKSEQKKVCIFCIFRKHYFHHRVSEIIRRINLPKCVAHYLNLNKFTVKLY